MTSKPQPPQEEPFSESHLGSPEYRERLMRKLNCLIAVLEVATAKVRKSLAGSPPDAERLTRICANLQSTLEVCQRARTALERRQETGTTPVQKALTTRPAPPPPSAKSKPEVPKRRRSRWGKGVPRTASDITSEAERRKFANLPPIDRSTIQGCDLDELVRRLSS